MHGTRHVFQQTQVYSSHSVSCNFYIIIACDEACKRIVLSMRSHDHIGTAIRTDHTSLLITHDQWLLDDHMMNTAVLKHCQPPPWLLGRQNENALRHRYGKSLFW